jgi:predicted PurR-regulated permease PerM
MDSERSRPRSLAGVVSPRELRLLFWLVIIVLVGLIGLLGSGIADTLSGPAVILFVAWLMAYVLEPAVTWLTRHLPVHSRGVAVAVTYLVTVIVTFVVLLGAGAALLGAALTFIEQLPEIVDRVEAALQPIAASAGLTPPSPVDLPAAVSAAVAENGDAIATAA